MCFIKFKMTLSSRCTIAYVHRGKVRPAEQWSDTPQTSHGSERDSAALRRCCMPTLLPGFPPDPPLTELTV